jgi:geranylgeranyl diphosphate synthase type II
LDKTDLQHHLLNKVEEGLKAIKLPAKPETLYQPYKYALSAGGKRIRPMLTLLACGLCEGDIDDALPAALATEILHNFTLVHDDIMDRADTRRGEPSVFKKWNQNIAILSGDVMFADAYQKLEYYGHSDAYTKAEYLAINEVFNRAIITVCEGQALDMEFAERAAIERYEYLEMIGGKTAALLSGALEMGAIAAHATQSKRDELSELGYELGLAFQIQDDLLDATADPEKFGKRPGGDIFEGKKTYLTIRALERANEAQAAIIQQTLEHDNPNPKDVQQVLSIMDELDVLKDVAGQIDHHYEHAHQLLNKFQNSSYKQELENLLIFLQKRDH